MSVVIEHFELDIPEEYEYKLSPIILSGELDSYLSDLVLRDLLAPTDINPNQIDTVEPAPLVETNNHQAIKDLMKEALDEWIKTSPEVPFIRTSKEVVAHEPEPVIDVGLEDLQRKPVEIKPGEGSKSVLDKFKKMRKG